MLSADDNVTLLPVGRRLRTATKAGRRGPLRPLLALTLAVTVFVTASTLLDEREVGRLPSAEKAYLLSRTVEFLRAECGPGRASVLADECRDEATFATRFPECRGECEALVRREFLPRPR